MSDDLLTVPEVALRLRCQPATVRDIARRGDLRGALVAGRWLFAPEDVREYVDAAANREPARRRRRRAS